MSPACECCGAWYSLCDICGTRVTDQAGWVMSWESEDYDSPSANGGVYLCCGCLKPFVDTVESLKKVHDKKD